jgi:hypothetical protein
VELCWVHRSTNGMADKLANEGANKEGLELDTTWINIPNGQLRTNCIQLATKDRESRLSKEGHIKKGSARPNDGHAKPRQDMIVEHSVTNQHA